MTLLTIAPTLCPDPGGTRHEVELTTKFGSLWRIRQAEASHERKHDIIYSQYDEGHWAHLLHVYILVGFHDLATDHHREIDNDLFLCPILCAIFKRVRSDPLFDISTRCSLVGPKPGGNGSWNHLRLHFPLLCSWACELQSAIALILRHSCWTLLFLFIWNQNIGDSHGHNLCRDAVQSFGKHIWSLQGTKYGQYFFFVLINSIHECN